ncbi:MAG: hypothetical protein JWQ42_4760 [Edaphobacter sp.]|nr:hypothetical protein [Edaphobacter sp.]MCU1318725.1 hypothetical protein [Edaphobacter sp.]
MLSFSWVDNRTLLACQALLTAIFAVVFFSMKRMYPYLRGAGSFALAFTARSIGSLLFLVSISVPYAVSVIGTSFFTFSVFLLFYNGILHFFRSPRKIGPAVAVVSLALLLLTYFAIVDEGPTYRTAVILITLFIIRGLVAIELFRQSAGKPILKLFAICLIGYIIFGLHHGVHTFRLDTSIPAILNDATQTPALILNVLFVCIIGLFFLLMLGTELLTIVENQSLQDPVSGALNRRGIDQRFTVELERAQRNNYTLSIALIDIDHFKNINDTAGHAAGDHALRQVVEAISSRLRSYDFFGRYGGDEFLLVLPQTSCQNAVRITERIQQAVGALAISKGAPLITLSIGLTQAVPGETVAAIMARADTALYEAKRAGRNCNRILLPAAKPLTDEISAIANTPIKHISTSSIVTSQR